VIDFKGSHFERDIILWGVPADSSHDGQRCGQRCAHRHAQGIAAQLDTLSTTGLLARFVGMVTDSRSVLSYSRHEYFRRLLCNLLGDEVRRGILPDDRDLLGRLVQNLSFANARDYFGFALGRAAATAEALPCADAKTV